MNKNRIIWLGVMILALLQTTVASAAAKTTTWQGGAGAWSEPAHWDLGVPVSGDTVVLSAATDGTVITNDIANLKLAILNGTGSNRIVLTGQSFELTDRVAMTFDCPLTITNLATVTLSYSASFWNPEVNLKGDETLFFNDFVITCAYPCGFGTGDTKKSIRFYGKVGDGRGQLCGKSGKLYFYDTVDLEIIGRNLNDSYFYFYKGDDPDSFSHFYVGYYGGTCICQKDVLATNTVLEWKDFQGSGGTQKWEMYTTGTEGTGAYRFYLSLWGDQTVDRVSQPTPIEGTAPNRKYLARILTQENGWWGTEFSSTLTLRGTADALAYATLMQKLSIVWDPVGDYTQTFAGCENSMSGTITVKGGTLKLAEGESFPNVPTLTVTGGTLELDASGTAMFPAVTALTISGNGSMKLTSNVTTTPFTAGLVEAVISDQGRFVLAEGTSVSLKTLVARGVLPANGTYTGAGYGTTGVEEVPWIVGAGRVTVTDNATDKNYWKTYGAGTWSDPDNWTKGHAPTANETVVLSAEGTYTLTLDAASPVPAQLTVGGPSAAVTLSMAGSHGVSNAWLEVKNGSTVDVPTGASLFYDGYGSAGRTVAELAGSPIKICGGGALTVSGGELIITNMTGLLEVGDDSGLEAKLAMTAGTFAFMSYGFKDVVRAHANGLLDFSGGLVRGRPTVFTTTPEMKDGARLRIRGTATITPDFTGADGSVFAVGDTSLVYSNLTDYNPYKSGCGASRFDGNVGFVRADFLDQFNGFAKAPNETYFGVNTGTALVTLSNLLYQAGSRGIDIGSYRTYWFTYVSKAPFVTGVVDVVDAAVTINGQSSSRIGWGSSHLAGLNVGYGGEPFSQYKAERSFVGELNLRRGAAVTNQYGDTSVGVGYGVGTLTVDGGSLVLAPQDNTSVPLIASERTFALGVFGGDGTCVVTNGGAINAKCDMYVGGSVLARYPYQQDVGTVGCPVDRHTAQGSLVVSDGTVTLARNLVLGSDGSGSVTVVGKDGTLAVGGDLVFSNTVENAASGGTLTYVLGADGVTTVSVAGKTVVGPSAKLVIDARNYDTKSNHRRVKLLTAAGGISGDFASTELLLAAGVPGEIVRSENGLDVLVGRGKGLTVIFW